MREIVCEEVEGEEGHGAEMEGRKASRVDARRIVRCRGSFSGLLRSGGLSAVVWAEEEEEEEAAEGERVARSLWRMLYNQSAAAAGCRGDLFVVLAAKKNTALFTLFISLS